MAYIPTSPSRRSLAPLSVLTLALLAACGGGGDDTAADGSTGGTDTGGGSTTAGGKLTLSAASPATHNGEIDVATAENTKNEARNPDGAISVPYCAVSFERASHSANTQKYYINVYFRQSDGKVLNASVFAPGLPWAVGHFDTAGIDGVTVNVATRTVTYADKKLTDISEPSSTATVKGSFVFPKNASVAACGA